MSSYLVVVKHDNWNFPICITICLHFRLRKGFSPAIQRPLMFFTEAGAHLIKNAHGACSFLSGTLIFRRIPTCRGDLAGWPLQKKLVAWWGPTSSSMFRDWLWLHSLCTPRSKKAEGISKTPSTLLFAAFSYGSAGFQAGYIHIGYAKHLVNQVQTLGPPNELSHKMQVLDSLSAFFRRGALP